MTSETVDIDKDVARWTSFMDEAARRVNTGSPLETRGTLTRLAGLVL